MTKPNENWNVLPHGKLTPIDDGMLTVEGRIRCRCWICRAG